MTPLLGTFSAASARGFGRTVNPTVPVPTPEYWWKADSGISTSGWTAVAGGLDFTFSGVTSANSSTGVLLGDNKYGYTPTVSSTIEAKHIFVRHDSYNSAGALLGGSFYNLHEFYFEGTYIVEGDNAGGLTYAAQNGSPGNKLTWVDFINGAAPQFYHDSSPTLAGTLTVYSGVYTNRFWWPDGNILLGIRQASLDGDGGYVGGYIKEIAIFTTSLTVDQGRAFQTNVMSRWP
jgi:hypothetical protein